MKVNQTSRFRIGFRVNLKVEIPTALSWITGKTKQIKISRDISVTASMTHGHAGQMKFYLNMLADQSRGTISDVKVEQI